MSKISEELRVRFTDFDTERDSGLSTPESVRRFDHISYGIHGEWNLLDVYRLKDSSELQPVIINVHGGGWIYGTKETYQYYGMDLAQRGFTVVNPSYRLAPESYFPAQLEDVNACVSWVLDHGHEYGMDTEQIFMVGDSAGAHLLTLYSSACTDPDFALTLGIQIPKGFVPKAVALNCGCYRPLHEPFLDNYDVMHTLMTDLLGEEDFDNRSRWIDAPAHITESFPPAFVTTALGDYMNAQTDYLTAAFEKLAVKYQTKVYGSEENPLWHVFHLYIWMEEAIQCNEDACTFFNSIRIDNK